MTPTPEGWMTWSEFMQLCHNSRQLPVEVLAEIEQVDLLMAELELLAGE